MNSCCERESRADAPRCVLEVSREDIRANVEVLRSRLGRSMIAVVKNNGYGLGLVPYAKLLLELGVRCLAVKDAQEGETLRRAHVTGDILVMTPPEDASSARSLAACGLIAAAGSHEDLLRLQAAAAAQNTTIRVHVKLETGFGRFGFAPGEAVQAAETLKRCDRLQAEGVFTHCGVLQPRQVQHQYDAFLSEAECLSRALGRSLCRHFCHSSLALGHPEMALDAVRVGSALLGRTVGADALGLRPVGRLRARVQAVHVMPAGSRPGYAGAEKLTRPTPVAVVAAGWQDGFGLERRRDAACPRELLSQLVSVLARAGQRRYVLYGDRPVPILGHGGMNFTLLNAQDVPLAVGDSVTLPVNPLLVPPQVPREYQ